MLIIDEREESQQKKRRLSVRYDLADDIESLARRGENIQVAACLAMNLYLAPANVLLTGLYWLGHYVNYGLKERDWFIDLVDGLLYHTPALSFVSSERITSVEPRLVRHAILMRFAGSELHQVPTEYFVQRSQLCLIESLSFLVQPDKACFLTRNAYGLRGEIELRSFVYDRVLSFFYEPSFFIITLYCLYFQFLLKLSGGRETGDWLPTVRHIMTPIHYGAIDFSRLNCLTPDSDSFHERMVHFREDMLSLYEALDSTDMETISQALSALWSNKAAFCEEEKIRRLQTITSVIDR